MNLFTIAWKSIRKRWLSSSLTALNVALGVALMVAVLILKEVLAGQFSSRSIGYDLVIGPKGSAVQLILSTVYHIDKPIENLPWRYYKEFNSPEYKEKMGIAEVIPIAIGDTTEQGDFPIVGTTPQYFKVPYGSSQDGPLQFKIPRPGHTFLRSTWDAVIGSDVAKRNNWTVGTKFKLVHGGADSPTAHTHDEEFTVRGVLIETGSPNDRSAFVHIAGFLMIAGHENKANEAIEREAKFFGEDEADLKIKYAKDLRQIEAEKAFAGQPHAAHEIPDLQKEVTSLLILLKSDEQNPFARLLRSQQFLVDMKSDPRAGMAIAPVAVLDTIMRTFVGNIELALMALIAVIILVSGISIFVSIYNSMADRRREIGIMRALGAQRRTVFGVILCESVLLCLGGGIVGILLGHGLMLAAAPFLESRSGLLIEALTFTPLELIVVPIMIVMASLVGFLPGLTAYRVDVATALQN